MLYIFINKFENHHYLDMGTLFRDTPHINHMITIIIYHTNSEYGEIDLHGAISEIKHNNKIVYKLTEQL